MYSRTLLARFIRPPYHNKTSQFHQSLIKVRHVIVFILWSVERVSHPVDAAFPATAYVVIINVCADTLPALSPTCLCLVECLCTGRKCPPIVITVLALALARLTIHLSVLEFRIIMASVPLSTWGKGSKWNPARGVLEWIRLYNWIIK